MELWPGPFMWYMIPDISFVAKISVGRQLYRWNFAIAWPAIHSSMVNFWRNLYIWNSSLVEGFSNRAIFFLPASPPVCYAVPVFPAWNHRQSASARPIFPLHVQIRAAEDNMFHKGKGAPAMIKLQQIGFSFPLLNHNSFIILWSEIFSIEQWHPRHPSNEKRKLEASGTWLRGRHSEKMFAFFPSVLSVVALWGESTEMEKGWEILKWGRRNSESTRWNRFWNYQCDRDMSSGKLQFLRVSNTWKPQNHLL